MVYGVGGADGVWGEPAVVLGAGVLLVPCADAGVEQAGGCRRQECGEKCQEEMDWLFHDTTGFVLKYSE